MDGGVTRCRLKKATIPGETPENQTQCIFFGGKKIPELMKGLGGGIKEFKKASKEEGKEEEEKLEEKK